MNSKPSPQTDKINPIKILAAMTDGQKELARALVLAAAGVIISVAIANQLVIPFHNHEWFTLAIGVGAILLTVGLLGWMIWLYHQMAVSFKNNATLRKQLSDQYRDLKNSTDQRLADLQRQLNQNRVAIDISRIITQNLDPQFLLEQVVKITQERFDLYYSGVFLVDPAKQIAVLRAGTGEAGIRMIARHHTLAIDEESMIGWAIKNKEPRISQDVGSEANRFKNPDLPLTRSEIALPLISHNVLLGALTFQSTSPDAFDNDDVATLQGVADVIATALDNSRLVQETRRNLDEINSLHKKYLENVWTEEVKNQPDLEYTYETGPVSEKPVSTVRLPLALRGQTIGFLNLEMDRAEITADEMALVQAITDQTALALENARLLEETQKKVGLEQMLNDLTTRFSRALDADHILRIALQELGHLPQVSEVSVYLKSPESDDLDRLAISEGGQND